MEWDLETRSRRGGKGDRKGVVLVGEEEGEMKEEMEAAWWEVG